MTWRISAATWPICCLSVPATVIIFLSTVTATPAGTWYVTGCEYPTLSVSVLPETAALKPMPEISSCLENPSVTPRTMLAIRLRNTPQSAACLWLAGFLTLTDTMPSTTDTPTNGCSNVVSLPFGPCADTIGPSMAMVVPAGTGIGCLPILDITAISIYRYFEILVDFADQFSTEPAFAGFAVG